MNTVAYQKTRTLFVTAFFFMLAGNAIAQFVLTESEIQWHRRFYNERVDSLKKELLRNHPDSVKVKIYLDMSAYVHSNKNIDSAFLLAQQALDIAKKNDDIPSIVESLSMIGGLHGNFGTRDYAQSIYHLTEAAKLAEGHQLYELIHKTYYSVLNIYFYNGDFPSAMELTTKGLALSEARQDVPKIKQYNCLLGFIYLRQGNAPDARKYYLQYLSLSETLKDSMSMADAYNCIAEVCFLENKIHDALEYHLKAWGVYQRHYNAGVSFKHDQVSYTAYKVSHTYKTLKEYSKALYFSSHGLNFTRRHGTNEYDLASYFLNAGELYKLQGDFMKSREWLRKGLNLSVKIKHRENIRDSYLLLSDLYKELKRPDSAYYFHVQYAALKDSIVNDKSRKEIQQMHAQYDLEKKDQAIAMQQTELDQREFQRNVVIAAFLFLVVIMFLLYNRYRLKQKNKFQSELAYQQNELFNTIVTFQDSERQRIAQDIHDSVGSVLSAAKLQLSTLEEIKDDLSPDHQENYKASLLLLDQATQELRNISHNIMPAALSRLGLIAALENLIDKISTYSGVRINFNVYGFKERLAEKTEIGIYPVVLELMNNILKHARASQATVQLVRHPQYINITIEDNGKGFDVKMQRGDGIGLKNVMSRIQYLKGSINIDSEEGQGTSIMIDIPY